ncbi:FtsX-like permease family protein [Mycobacterium sp. ITM-2016-00318]|uniref:ABC transporter permease n=1 Tax=Mycobacterium sp. ITM-2016-00318 TaxID=2099693 RepID=UPI000CFA5949|nr:FtsX-like permease family protein [Mycobacterium sp. ITM-2016-00318]WNG94489.1 FtsX-like permease family protein [Mycobacterium sp. ITM-2016-00318]
MSRILLRKVRRDLWRRRWQFLAAVVVLAIGVGVFVAATDAYANLKQSFDRTYAVQLLPDAVLSGPGTFGLHEAARALPGNPIVELRQQADVPIRINGRTLFGRAVSVPTETQPAVSKLALQSGDLPGRGSVLVEEHLSEYYGLRPGSKVELLGPSGWRRVVVSGSALSPEYLWPARSRAETLTTPEYFGVVFVPASDMAQVAAEPTDQLLVYARDRNQAQALLTAATELARSYGTVIMSRDELPSYTFLNEGVESVRTFARMLPWVFLVAAVVGTYVLLSRLVSAQRAVIGTLSANGLSGRTIIRHYLSYGMAVGFAGATAGLIGGYALGGWYTTQYTQALGLPLRVTSLHPSSLIIGAMVGVASAALAAWAPARAASGISPAQAMRISPPGVRGFVSVAERLLPPLRRMPTRWRMTLRGITRNRRRTILTVAGVASSVCLVMVFAGMRDTVNSVIDRQYGEIERQDAQVLTAAGAADSVARTLRSDPQVAAAELFTRLDVTVQSGRNRYDTLLIGLPRTTQMHRFISARSSRSLPRDGVLLGEGLRTILGVAVGDRISITDVRKGIRLQQPVAGFVDEPMSPVIYIAAEQLSALPPSGVMLRMVPGVDQDAKRQAVTVLPGVTSYLSTDSMSAAVRKAFKLYNVLVALTLVSAAVMAAALLYNAMSANVSERTGELATLHAVGMGARMLGRLVALENMMLAVIGLPIGLIAGMLLAEWFLSTYITQGYQWHLAMHFSTPLFVVVGILIAALLTQIPTFRVLGRMDVATVVRERSL